MKDTTLIHFHPPVIYNTRSQNLHYKAPESYFTHYSGVVIILFNMGLAM